MKEKINYKKLFFEGNISLALVFMATTFLTLQAVSAYGIVNKDKYAGYREIVDAVDEYDYKNGRDNVLEKEIDSKFATSEGDEQFFYGLARAIYYCNIGFYNTALDTFYEIGYIAPDEAEYNAMKVRSVLCERKSEK